jgi:alpha-beta hydrolase superfamily lysophospholipase
MPTTHPPVILIHGLWPQGTSWRPWMDLFAAKGYDASAMGWPGDAASVTDARAKPQAVADVGVARPSRPCRTRATSTLPFR